jgi:hypothetical protein
LFIIAEIGGEFKFRCPAGDEAEITCLKALDELTQRWPSHPHIASTRVGPPEAVSTFGAPTKTVAPLGGIFPRFATHSTAHLLAPSHSL